MEPNYCSRTSLTQVVNPSKVETIVKVKCSTREWELSYKVSDLVGSATSCFIDLFHKGPEVLTLQKLEASEE